MGQAVCVCVCVCAEGDMGISVLPAQFFCEPKTVLSKVFWGGRTWSSSSSLVTETIDPVRMQISEKLQLVTAPATKKVRSGCWECCYRQKGQERYHKEVTALQGGSGATAKAEEDRASGRGSMSRASLGVKGLGGQRMACTWV